MTRKFITNLAFLLFLNLMVKPVSIWLDILVQNRVGAVDYGLYFAVFNFTFLFHLILDLGISNYNNRSVAQDKGHIKQFLSSLLILKMGLAGLYALVSFWGGELIGFTDTQMYLLGFLIFNQIFLSAVLFFRSTIGGMHLFRLDSILSVLDKVLLIGFLAYLLLSYANFKIEWFVWAQTASLGITALVAGILVAVTAGHIKLRWEPAKLWLMLKSTFPYALLGILMSIYYRIDGVMIERMLPEEGAYQAGMYAASFRLMDAANIVGLLFANLLLPMFARMIQKGDDLNHLSSFSFKMLAAGALLLSGLLYYFGIPIMHSLYTNATHEWGQLAGVLFLAFAAVCTVYVYGTLLTANGSMKALNTIAALGMLLNIALNFYLIPRYQALGAAFATVITQWIVAVAHIVAAQQVFKLQKLLTLVGQLALYSFLLFGVGYFVVQRPWEWPFQAAILVTVGIVLAFAIRLIYIKEFIQLLKEKGA